MCGRFGVEDDLSQQVESDFNIAFHSAVNANICPSMLLPTIIKTDSGLQQFNGSWGIKPSWSNKLLINAQSETAATKPTFKNSFQHYRCIIPMSYWYEWCEVEGQKQKVKYKFSPIESRVFYMAGIFFPTSENDADIVSLTTSPNDQYKAYHHRMPLLVDSSWLETAHFESAQNIPFLISS
ncbi:MAG: SOS response-associated peptidase family protein [Gammaproteobacteria bacterium]|nr:SOS response-associated peptidase family protein [Gammaproteobacteria bacterium]